MINAEYLAHQRAFSDEAFGPGRRIEGIIDHITKELIEVRESNGSLSEWVDIIILGFDGATRSAQADGLSMQAVVDAITSKQAANERRQWPDWRNADPDKAIEHVRDDA